jgi:thymidine phosphorylase
MTRVRSALASGAGLEVFRRIVEHQGGDPRVVDDYGLLPSAPDREPVLAARPGYVTGMHAEAIGHAAVALGAGRSKIDDVVDPGVGIEVLAPVGAEVAQGQPVLMLHHRQGRGLAEARRLAGHALVVADGPAAVPPLVVERVMNG